MLKIEKEKGSLSLKFFQQKSKPIGRGVKGVAVEKNFNRL